jgi:hypothetical protein
MCYMAMEYVVNNNTRNYGKKNQIWTGVKKTPYHFGQINFNMFSVIEVVFLINRIKTIWLVKLFNLKKNDYKFFLGK